MGIDCISSVVVPWNSKHFKAYYNRAFARDKLGDYEGAVSDYSKAIELEDGNANAHHNRGSALEKLNRCDMASINFTQVPVRVPIL